MATKDALPISGEPPPSEDEGTPADWNNPRVLALLDAAATLFARKGFASATLAELGGQVGLRKSIVHYYFESKAALIHEVQRFAYHKYMETVKTALDVSGETAPHRMLSSLQSLWAVRHDRWATTALNIELWSATRRDPQLKRRAASLQKESRSLIREITMKVLGVDETFPHLDALCTLILCVLNGVAILEYLEEDEPLARRAYEAFSYFLRLGILDMEKGKQRP